MEQIEAINKLMAVVDDVLWGKCAIFCSAAGLPARRAVKIINGHRVEVFKFDDELFVELNKSTKKLTLAEAIATIVS